jgi:hypothetical protein
MDLKRPTTNVFDESQALQQSQRPGLAPVIYPDICDFLIGTWKRNLRWKHFGGMYQNLRTTNMVAVVEEFTSTVKEPGVRYLKWSFGKNLSKSELRFGYVMKLRTDPNAPRGSNVQTSFEWQYNGHPCVGTYQPITSATVLNFHLKSSTVVITYRILDQHTMAVCIVEITEQHVPTIQIGNMCRINPDLYNAEAASLAGPASARSGREGPL